MPLLHKRIDENFDVPNDSCKVTFHVKNVFYKNLGNGGYTAWSSWSSCSVTCASGTKSRKRSCTNPTPVGAGATCSGASTETVSCTLNPCPSKLFLFLFCFPFLPCVKNHVKNKNLIVSVKSKTYILVV